MRNKIFLATLIVGLVLALLGFMLGSNTCLIIGKNGVQLAPKENSVHEQTFENISNITITSNNAEIEVKKGEIASVKVEYFIAEPKVSFVNDNLDIRLINSDFSYFTIGIGNMQSEKIIITVPNEVENVKVSSDNGAVLLSDLIAQTTDIDVDNGKVEVRNCASQTGKIKADNGRVVLNSFICENNSIKTNNGGIYVSGEITGSNTYKTDNGKIEIEIDETTGASYDCRTNNGSVKYGGKKYGNSFTKESGYPKIKAETNNGGVIINPSIQ